MADISAFTSQILNAKRGETVRDAITGAIKTMSRDGVNAEKLSGRPLSYFALADEVNEAFLTGLYKNKNVFESEIIKGSTKAVQGGAIYDMITDLNDDLARLLGESL